MATNTGGGTTASFSNTPQAQGDTYYEWEDILSTWYFDVMSNDLAGNAKVLWSVDDGTNSTSSTLAGSDLLVQDTVRVEATSGDTSKNGARIWITSDGKVAYDATTLSGTFRSAVQALSVGQNLTDTFIYAIRMSNGTLSWTTVTIVYQGQNDGVVMAATAQAGVTEDVTLSRSGTASFTDPDLGDTHTATFAADPTNSTHLGTFSIGPVSESGGSGSVGWNYQLNNGAAQYLGANDVVYEKFVITVSDGHGGNAQQTITVAIHGTNDIPLVVAGGDGSGAVQEDVAVGGDAKLHDTGSFSFTDVDLSDSHSVSVTPSASGYVGALTATVVHDSTGGATGEVDWSFAVDNSAVQSLGENQSITQTYTVTVNDGNGGTAQQTVTVTITGTNDAPVVTGSGTLSYTENQAAAVINPSITVGDVDSPTLTGATVAITGNFASGQDVLAFVNQNGITGSYNAASGVLTLTGSATVAQYQAALASVTYSNSSDNPSGATRTISFRVDDGATLNHASNVATSTVSVTPVNDAPVNTVPGALTANQQEDKAVVGLSVTDPDSGAAAITTTLSVLHGTMTVSNVVGGAAVSGSGTASVTLTGTAAQINATLSALNGVVYHGNVGFHGSDTLTVATNDGGASGGGGALSDSDTVAITVLDTIAPDQPTITSVSDDVAPITGTVANGGITNDTTPTLSGSAEVGSTVRVYDGATFLGSVVADGSGAWAFTPSVGEGNHSFTVTATDAANNVSVPSSAYSVIVDNTAPVAGTLSFANLTDSGSADSTPITQDGTFDLSLAGDTDANGVSVAYEVSTNGGATWSATTASQASLADGDYLFHAVVTDPAGNSSTSNAIEVIVDNTAPVAGTLSFANLTDSGSADSTPITQDGTFDLSLAGDTDANGVSVAYEVSTNGGATWSATTASQASLADGDYLFHAVVTDPAGNSSTSNAIEVIVDNTAPVAGTLSFANLTDSGSADSTPITQDGTFDLSLAGDTDANGVSVAYEVSTNGGATWSATTASQASLADGDYLFHAVVTDPAGNSSTSNAIEVIVDNTAPVAGTLSFANLTDSGSADSTPITQDGTFDLSLAGDTDANGVSVAYEVSTNGGATWSATTASQASLADGDYLFHAVVTDPAGNSSTSNAIEVIVDNTAPVAGTLSFANLTDSGSADSTPITQDGTFDLSLAGDTDANGVSVAYEVSTNGGATWSATTASQASLADGDYLFHAVVTDPAGNSSTSNAIEVIVDNTAPVAGTLSFANLTDSGSADSTPITQDGTFDLSLAGDTDANGVSVAYEVSTNGGATWSATTASQASLADGDYLFHAVVTDPAGNSSTSNAIEVIVDNTAPVAGTLSFANLTDSGSADSTPITQDGTFDLSLAGDTDANGVSVAYEVSTNGGATWSATTASQASLADGDYLFHAVVTDPAGNSSTSNAIEVIVDNTAPVAGTLSFANLTDSGSADSTPITQDGTFDLSLAGDTDANGVSVAYEVSTNGGATWSATTASQASLADGDYLFHAVVTDPAGNSSTSNAIEVIVDNTAPVAGTLSFANLTDSGSADSTPITQDGTFDLSLAGDTDANGVSVAYEVSTNGGATWSATTASQASLADGDYLFHAVVTDPAGNSSTSNAIEVIVDNTAPVAGTLSFANLTDSGSADSTPITQDGTFDLSLAGDTDANGVSVAYEVSTNGGATWSATTASQASLADGDYLFHAVVTDPAGNSSTSNAIEVIVDNTAPVAGTLSFANLTDSGSADSTPITQDGTFDLSLAGDTDANGVSVAYEVSTNGGATWSATTASQASLADGDYLFHAVVTDPAGNSSTSNAIEVIVDNTAPVAGTLSFANLTDSGSADSTPITQDGTFDLSLAGDTDANGVSVAYEVSTNGGATWSATTASQASLADGDYLFHAVVTDPAGNSSTSNAIEVIVDNTAPVAGTLSFANLTDSGSADSTPITQDGTFDLSLAGDTDANGVSVAYEVSTNGGATWSATTASQASLADGDYLFHAVVTDPAGNSSTSNAIEVIVDNTAPVAGTLSFANLTDSGSADSTPITQDGTFDLSLAGDTDANGVSVAYEVSTNGGATWSATTASQASLADGDYLFHAVVTDPAGNSSTSNAIEVIVDNTAPVAGTLSFANLTDSGSADSTPITQDGTFDLSLAGDTDANGVSVAYEVSTNGGATWSATTASQASLADGDYLFHAVVTDPAGNSSTSNAIEVIVDNTAPVAGTLSFANLTDSGSADSTPITQDGTFDLSLAGDTDANGVSVAYEVSTNGGATWSATTASQASLADGDYLFHAVVTDPAGNSSTSNAIEVIVDNTAPVAGTLSFANLTDSGSADSTPITQDGTFDLSLAGDTDANGVSVAYEVSTNGGATWSATTASQASLADGDYLFHAVVTDPAGNSSTSNAIEVIVDNTAPVAGTLSFANLTDSGSADSTPITQDGTFDLSLAGDTDANGVSVAYEVSTNGGATWSATTASQASLADGDYLFHAVVTDPAGNSSTSNAIEVIVDNTAPVAGTLSFANLTDSGSADSTPITQDGTFDLSLAGDTDANGVSVAYEVSTNGGATWSATTASQASLADGDYLFHAVVTDPAGNSSTSNAIEVIVDNTAPVAGTLSFANLTDSGSADSTPITQDGTFDLSLAGDTDANGVSVAYEVSTNGGATWSATTASQASLADGDYLFHAVVTDPAGNSSTSNAIEVIVDNTAPVAGTLSFANLTDSGSADSTPITQDGTFDLSLAGDTDANGVSVAYEVSTNGGATWSATTASQASLADGDYLFHAVVTDPAGNSSTSNAIEVIVDNTAPVAGTLSFANLTDSGSADSTPITQDGTFDLSLAGDTDANGVSVAYEVSTNGGATWSATTASQASLADGDYLFHAVVTDPAGNSSTSNAIEVIVDNTAPVAGTLSFANLTDSGSADSTPITQDGTFDLSLAGDTDANGVSVAYEVSTNGGATWSATTASQASLADGDYLFHAVVTDPAGNSSTSNAIEVIVDNTAPVAGTLSFANLTDSGSADSTPITQDGTFDLSLAGDTDANGVSVAYEVSTNGGATWSATTASQASLADGDYLFHAVVTDPAGNSSTSNAIEVIVDNTAPVAGTLSFANLTDSGSADSTPITQDGTFDLSLAGDTDANGVSVAYEVSTNGGATWSATTASQASLADGDYLFHAVVTDPAGNSSTSNAIEVIVDNTAPVAGTLSFANLTDSGSADSTPITQDGTFDLSLAGDTDANGVSVAYEVSTNGGATWSATTASQASLADGDYLFHAVVTDPAGNSSTSNAIEVIVDNTAPVAGTLSFANLTDSGSADSTPITQDGTFDLSLAGDTDANGVSVAYEVSTNGGATWSATTASQASLADGDYLFHAVVTDPAGNSSTSNAIEVIVDNTAPTAPTITSVTDDVLPVTGTVASGASTNDTTPTLSGSAEANSTVTIKDGATVLGTATANGSGAWTFTPSPLAQGGHSFTATATDAAGNVSNPSSAYSVTVDTTAPNAPTITSVTDDISPQTGVVASGGSTNDPDVTVKVTITGTGAVAGNTIQLYNGTGTGSPLGSTYTLTATDITNGFANVQSGTLTNGTTYSLTARVTDGAGNQSNASPTYNVTEDTTAPTAPTITSVTDDISPQTGVVASGGSTNDPDVTVKVTITGTGAVAGNTIQLYNGTGTGSPLGSTYTLTATDITNGFANVQTGTLTNGTTYSLTARVADAAGNQSGASGTYTVTEDTTAPTAPTITSVTDDISPQTGIVASGGRTNDPDVTVKVTITGTGAVAGDTIQLYNGSGTGSPLGGAYTLTASDITNGFANVQSGTLTNGTTYSLTARVTDGAGNQSGASTTYAVTEDTTAPTAPTITSVNDDVSPQTGVVASGGSTNDPDVTVKVTITGTGAVAGDTIQLYNGAGTGSPLGSTYTLTASDITNGFANVQSGTLTSGTTYNLTARVTDGAGNQGNASATYAVVEDSTAPLFVLGLNSSGSAGNQFSYVMNKSGSNFTFDVTASDTNGIASVTIFNVTSNTSLGNATLSGGIYALTVGNVVNNGDVIRVTVTDSAGNTAIKTATVASNHFAIAPAGVSGSPINLALHDPADAGALVTVAIGNMPSGWTLDGGTQQPDGSWTIQTTNLSSLTVTTPADYSGAELLNVTATWTNADGSPGSMSVGSNVEAYAPGSPIFAWSGDDTLTGSAGADDFVFSQPIGMDVVHSFDASADTIDLIGYSGISSFADVQAHLSAAADGSAIITLADGQSITLEGVSASSLTAANFEFNVTPTVNNAGTITIGDGALLPMSGTINNSGTISLNANGEASVLQLIQNGITLQGGGHVVLSDSAGNLISGTLPSITFNNVDNIISGAGNIGGGSMVLTNGGTIIADGVNALVIETGDNAVVNSGTIEATGLGGLNVMSSMVNDGLILAQSGSITIGGDLSGSGHVELGGSATIEFGGHSSNDIALDANATGLIVFDHSADFSGTISGLNADDRVDLRDLQFGANATLTYADNGSGGGVLTISDGLHSVQLHLSGSYQSDDFTLGSDGNGGVLLTNHLGLFG